MENFLSSLLISSMDDIESIFPHFQNGKCSLNSFQWDNGMRPDYSNIFHRKLYILKYSYGYIYDYYSIYKYIFENELIAPKRNISVLSIGCGPMFDLVGLKFAKNDIENFKNSKIHYYGIDSNKWDKIKIRGVANIYQFQKTIENLSRVLLNRKIDIIFLGRSADDIGKCSLIKFAKKMKRSSFNNKLCIANVPGSEGKISDSREALLPFLKKIKKIGKFCELTCHRDNNIFYATEANKDKSAAFYNKYCPKEYRYEKSISWRLQGLFDRCPTDCLEQRSACEKIALDYPRAFPRWHPDLYIMKRGCR